MFKFAHFWVHPTLITPATHESEKSMAKGKLSAGITAGALIGLGLYGIGAFIMNKVMPHGDASRPLWHENTIGISATGLVMIFFSLLMLVVLFITESMRPVIILLRFTAVWVILWSVAAALVF